ncbi:EAL domain-containing protein [Solicola sp. PLA-1-18]|uniref:bifunctional diguanylate cyclase/phosphodiesterase n=1 Tax=Solicola sp. PLA-1-18 TaxID=3380532 RepID=UPI003B786D2C
MTTHQDDAVLALGRAIEQAPDPTAVVDRIVAAAARTIGSGLAAVTLSTGDDATRTAAAVGDLARRAEDLQHALAAGPCLMAVDADDVVRSDDLSVDTRWPRWGRAAAELGVRSLLCTPLVVGGRTLGTLTVYATEVGAFARTDESLVHLFAHPVALGLLATTRQLDFTRALATRTAIGQAQGILMERFTLDADQSFDVLRRYSQSLNLRLADVADDLTRTRLLPSAAADVDADLAARVRRTDPFPQRPGLVGQVSKLLELTTEDLPADVLLRRLCEAAGAVVPSDGVGVMVTDDGRNRFVHATTEPAAELDRLQEELRTGPCREAAETSNRVVVDDPAGLHRWPRFGDAADRLGIATLAAVPLVSRGRCWGVLDLYRQDTAAWTEDDLAVATLLADVATAHLVTVADREESRLARIQLGYHSTHDALTGLPNRVLLFDRLERSLAASARSGSGVVVLFVDLVEFTLVNDVHGHRAGDQVLREVARRLGTLVTDGGTLARLGGDQLVLVHDELDGAGAEAAGRTLAAAVHEALTPPVELEAGQVQVAAKVGVAVGAPGMSAEELVDEADNAMFESDALMQGEVGVRDFSAHRRPSRRPEMVRDLPLALEREQLAVHYQPVVTATSPYPVVAVEALLRWRDADGHVVPARSFIDLAVRRGLMPAFGTWAVEEVCTRLASWRDELGYLAPATAYVNLSARELNDPSLPATLAAATERHGLDPSQLGLEVVEESFVHAGLVHRLAELRGRGHPLAIDDFGTGYSSLSRLLDVPADVVKIDRAFIDGLPRDKRRSRFVESIVQMATSLEVRVVAEGVETTEQRDFLADAGFDRLQGFLFGRPMPASELVPQLAAREEVVLVHHLLSGESVVVGRGSALSALMRWFRHGPVDVLDAVEDLQEALLEHRSTRSLENYLGVEVTSA